jgi:hypothetical protein
MTDLLEPTSNKRDIRLDGKDEPNHNPLIFAGRVSNVKRFAGAKACRLGHNGC